MRKTQVDQLIEGLRPPLEAQGISLQGLTFDELRDALSHPKAGEELMAARGREAKSVREGGAAFDFSLPRLGGPNAGERVTVSSYLGKRPVALIFGSYT